MAGTYSIWMKIPPTQPDRPGFSRIIQGLPKDVAEIVEKHLNFEGRAVPESEEE